LLVQFLIWIYKIPKTVHSEHLQLLKLIRDYDTILGCLGAADTASEHLDESPKIGVAKYKELTKRLETSGFDG